MKDIHGSQNVVTAGAALTSARGAMVLVHGRGASAESMITLFNELHLPGFAALAPQAAGKTWYPNSFLASIESNQPNLDSALARIESVVSELVEKGMKSERIVLFGFSQGACLVSESVARNPRRYGGVICLTGGLIGPEVDERKYSGSLDGTPLFLGTGDPDSHVPLKRVTETERILTRMGAAVELRVYPGRPHSVSSDELEMSRRLVEKIS